MLKHFGCRYSAWLPLLVLLLTTPLGAQADDSDLWSEACAKVDAGDLTDAATLLNQLLTDFPSSPKAPGAQLKLAYIKVKTSPNSTQELLDAFSQVRTKYASSPEAGVALVRIGYLHSRTDTGQAVKDFEDFLAAYKDHPQSARVTRALGGLHLRDLELDKAEAAFDSVRSASGASTALVDEATMQSAFVKIMRFYASKDKTSLTAAISIFGGLSTSSNSQVRGKSELGAAEALLLMGNALEAHQKYKSAAQTYSDQPYIRGIALYGVAICSKDMQKAGQAVAEYDALLDAQAGSTLADKDAAWKAVALASLGSRAQAAVQKSGSLEPIPAINIIQEASYLKGECLYMAGKYQEAQHQLSAVVSAFPGTELAESAKNAIARCRMAI